MLTGGKAQSPNDHCSQPASPPPQLTISLEAKYSTAALATACDAANLVGVALGATRDGLLGGERHTLSGSGLGCAALRPRFTVAIHSQAPNLSMD